MHTGWLAGQKFVASKSNGRDFSSTKSSPSIHSFSSSQPTDATEVDVDVDEDDDHGACFSDNITIIIPELWVGGCVVVDGRQVTMKVVVMIPH